MIQIRPPILRTVLPHLMCVRLCSFWRWWELHHRFGHLLCSCSPQCHYDHVASFPATTFNFKPELGQPINPDTNVRITLLTWGSSQSDKVINLFSAVLCSTTAFIFLPVHLLFPIRPAFLPHQLITQNSTNSRLLLIIRDPLFQHRW